ncbi:MAG: O-antigen ligase family protein [Oscillospiraceae bacterium]|nr:O-antigen ligase family protein [Oscillospiraceae bacterium]
MGSLFARQQMPANGAFAQSLTAARRFLLSDWALLAQAILACFVIVLHGEIPGMAGFLLLFSAICIVSDNILATAPSFFFTSLFLIKCDNSLLTFLPLWWLVLFPLAGLLFHFIAYRRPLQTGRSFLPMLGVSVAVTLGGTGALSSWEYFSGASLYHVLALGFGMLLAYVLLRSHVRDEPGFRASRWLSLLLLTLGLLGAFMVFHHYLEHLSFVLEKRTILPFQWRNNISSFLMLALPFAFGRGVKHPFCIPLGLLIFGALLLTGSRGGLIFGFVELLLCGGMLLLADRKRRMAYLIAAAVGAAAALVTFNRWIGFLSPALLRLLRLLSPDEQEARELLYARAIADFKRHPVFGVGIGYMGNRDVHPSKAFALCWYHNSVLQVLGSTGLLGVAAYLFQFVTRCVIFLRRRSLFQLTLFIAWVGIEMMSLVNPGVFAPIPYLLLVTMFVVFAEKESAA